MTNLGVMLCDFFGTGHARVVNHDHFVAAGADKNGANAKIKIANRIKIIFIFWSLTLITKRCKI